MIFQTELPCEAQLCATQLSNITQAGMGVCIQITSWLALQAVLPLGGTQNLFPTDLIAIQLAAMLLWQHAQVGPIALHTTSKSALKVMALTTAAMDEDIGYWWFSHWAKPMQNTPGKSFWPGRLWSCQSLAAPSSRHL